MRFLKRFFAWGAFLTMAVFGLAQNIPTISPNEVPSYVNKTVSVQGTVIRVDHISKLYLMHFTQEKGGFTGVIPEAKYIDMESAGIDINAIEGKRVTVTGQIIKDQYGMEMNLTDPANQMILPEAATEIKYASGQISVDEVPNHVGQYATVQGKVLTVDISRTGTTYLLRLTNRKNGFTVVIFPPLASIFKKANIDLKSYAGRTVRVTGNIKYYEQYGYEIILDKMDNLKEVN